MEIKKFPLDCASWFDVLPEQMCATRKDFLRKQMDTMSQRGVFRVSRGMLSLSEPMKALFSECVPVRGECLLAEDVVEYTALSEHFDSIPYGASLPRYRPLLTVEPDGKCSVTFERITVKWGSD